MKHYLFDIIILVIMFLSLNSIQTYFHESIHAQICESFGGNASTKHNPLWQGGETTCSIKDGDRYNIINDIVSYAASVIVIAIFMALIFFSISCEKERIKEEHELHESRAVHVKIK